MAARFKISGRVLNHNYAMGGGGPTHNYVMARGEDGHFLDHRKHPRGESQKLSYQAPPSEISIYFYGFPVQMTDGQTENNAYDRTMQVAQVGSIKSQSS